MHVSFKRDIPVSRFHRGSFGGNRQFSSNIGIRKTRQKIANEDVLANSVGAGFQEAKSLRQSKVTINLYLSPVLVFCPSAFVSCCCPSRMTTTGTDQLKSLRRVYSGLKASYRQIFKVELVGTHQLSVAGDLCLIEKLSTSMAASTSFSSTSKTKARK